MGLLEAGFEDKVYRAQSVKEAGIQLFPANRGIKTENVKAMIRAWQLNPSLRLDDAIHVCRMEDGDKVTLVPTDGNHRLKALAELGISFQYIMHNGGPYTIDEIREYMYIHNSKRNDWSLEDSAVSGKNAGKAGWIRFLKVAEIFAVNRVAKNQHLYATRSAVELIKRNAGVKISTEATDIDYSQNAFEADLKLLEFPIIPVYRFLAGNVMLLKRIRQDVLVKTLLTLMQYRKTEFPFQKLLKVRMNRRIEGLHRDISNSNAGDARRIIYMHQLIKEDFREKMQVEYLIEITKYLKQ